MAYVTNSTGTFNLGAEEIIYLKDVGVPDPVVTAMILRDQALRTQPALAQAATTPWVPPAPEIQPAPPPAEVAPQPDATAANYPPEPGPAGPEAATDTTFYNDLAPYGTWADLDGYGPCWQPSAAVLNPGWQPYYNCGRWVWTDCGWYWYSDYSWGWAPFHYGRWFRHHQLGWCWAPDHVWGPSWVSWRYNDGYCGWAPLPPGAYFAAGIGITYHGHHVAHWEDCGLKSDHYRFVAWNHFNSRNLQHEHLSTDQHNRAFHDSVVATRFSGEGQRIINHGPSPQQVAAATHAPVRTTALRDGVAASSIGRSEHLDPSARTLTVYRPKLPASSHEPGHWPSADSAMSAPSSLSAPSAPSADTVAHRYPGNHGSTTLNSSGGRPWETTSSPRPGQNPPLILRGPQSSATREVAPPSSMVIIGRKDNQQSRTVTRPPLPTTSAAPAGAAREPLALNNPATPWMRSNGRGEPNAENWSRGPAPTRQPAANPWNNNSGNAYQRSQPVYRPAPSYQAPPRMAPAEAPRSVAPPVQSAPLANTPPPSSAPARSAPSAPAQSGRGQR